MKAVAPPTLHRRAVSCRLAVRRACAQPFVDWRTRNSINVLARPLPYGCVRRYLDEGGLSPSADLKWLVRQARALQRTGLQPGPLGGTTAGVARRRMPGAGRPHKAPALREELPQCVLSARGTCSSRLPLSDLSAAARSLRTAIMAVAVRRKKRTSVPQITPQWLLRWRRDYQVSLRLPNRRWTSLLADPPRASSMHLSLSDTRAEALSAIVRLRPSYRRLRPEAHALQRE